MASHVLLDPYARVGYASLLQHDLIAVQGVIEAVNSLLKSTYYRARVSNDESARSLLQCYWQYSRLRQVA